MCDTDALSSTVLLRLGDLEGAMVAEMEEQAERDALMALEMGGDDED